MRILYSDILAHPDSLYIFADDKTGRAYRGQAEEAHGAPNALPIYTRIWPCSDSSNLQSQWCSMPTDMVKEYLTKFCFEPIQTRLMTRPEMKVIIFPKIGEGCSRLKWNNPVIYKFIHEFLDSIRRNS